MKIISRTLLSLSLPALLLATGSAYATARLQTVESSVQSSGKTALRLHFDSKVSMPKSFTMKQPASIVLDFPDAATAMGKRSKQLNSRSVKNVRIASGAQKLRIMVSLKKLTKYTTSIRGNDVVLTFEDKNQAIMQPRIVPRTVPHIAPRTAHHAAPKKPWEKRKQARRNVTQHQPQAINRAARLNQTTKAVVKKKSVKRQAVASNYVQRPQTQTARYRPTPNKATYRPPVKRSNGNLIGAIDFQRTQNGGGSTIIGLPSHATITETHKVGNVIVITLKNVNVRQAKKRIDVLDYATPVSFIDIARKGKDTQIRILANKAFTYTTDKTGKQLIVTMKKVKRRVVVNPINKKKHYTGKKLSLNFQDIEVRSVLQLLADFTDKNIVVSDSVKGNITLRLKDVPWDQALDIVLESKGLAMRNNGNVIWVAPAAELAAKEQNELQAIKRKQNLEPLITEYISVNYAKAADLLKLIQSAGKGKKDASLISKRGSISVDARTNTLLVQDMSSRVNDIRALVRTLDVPVRQVSIESRIVYATDEFGKELGARFGATKFGAKGALSGGIGSTNSMVNDLIGGSSSVGVPSLNDRLSVNMPVAGAAGSLAFSLLSKDYLLDLELSALQAENKGEVISSPRVVTADKRKAVIEKGVEVPYEVESLSGGTTIAFKKAVLGLEVTPQITPDEHISMDLVVRQDEINKYYQSASGNSIPIIDTRNVTTQVLVDNGQTVVLGGVHEETKSNDVRKVPVLGDLPVLGNIFKKTAKKNVKRELLIFVTPKILR